MAKSKFQHPDDAVLLTASLRPPMTRWEKRAQAISFAAYNVLLDKPAGTDPWPYMTGAAKAHDERCGEWCEGVFTMRVFAPRPHPIWNKKG